jgi:hypothetical protein
MYHIHFFHGVEGYPGALAESPVKQRPEERMEHLLKTVSASLLTCWYQCRLKFYFRNVLQLIKPR